MGTSSFSYQIWVEIMKKVWHPWHCMTSRCSVISTDMYALQCWKAFCCFQDSFLSTINTLWSAGGRSDCPCLLRLPNGRCGRRALRHCIKRSSSPSVISRSTHPSLASITSMEIVMDLCRFVTYSQTTLISLRPIHNLIIQVINIYI
jgi:hypothetical protein